MKFIILFLIFVYASPLISRFTISQYILPSKMLKMQMEVIAPVKHGQYPAILYLTGFEGLLPWFMQTQLLESIASEGYVVMAISQIQSVDPTRLTKVLHSVIDWMNLHLQFQINIFIPGVKADLQNRFMLMAHSAAAHSITQYLNGTCQNVKLQILLDPVDGIDPVHSPQQDFITHPGKLLPYATPVIIIQAEFDPVRVIGNPTACAPDNISNTRYYNAMSGPKWFVNISDYGHADFFDEQFRILAGVTCMTCKKNCNFKNYRNLIKDIIVNFSTGILEKDESKLKWIEGNSSFIIPTIKKHDYMGYDPLSGGFCERKQSILKKQKNFRYQ